MGPPWPAPGEEGGRPGKAARCQDDVVEKYPTYLFKVDVITFLCDIIGNLIIL